MSEAMKQKARKWAERFNFRPLAVALSKKAGIEAHPTKLELFFDDELTTPFALSMAEFASAQVKAERERIAKMCEEWITTDCHHHDENPCCHTRTAVAIAKRIREE